MYWLAREDTKEVDEDGSMIEKGGWGKKIQIADTDDAVTVDIKKPFSDTLRSSTDAFAMSISCYTGMIVRHASLTTRVFAMMSLKITRDDRYAF